LLLSCLIPATPSSTTCRVCHPHHISLIYHQAVPAVVCLNLARHLHSFSTLVRSRKYFWNLVQLVKQSCNLLSTLEKTDTSSLQRVPWLQLYYTHLYAFYLASF
jgi:hypothetical protein